MRGGGGGGDGEGEGKEGERGWRGRGSLASNNKRVLEGDTKGVGLGGLEGERGREKES